MLRFGLYALLIFVAAIGGMLGRRIWLERQPAAGIAEFYVGGHRLKVERAMVRNPDLRNGGAVNRLDLAVRWPDFAGAAAEVGAKGAAPLVFIALEDATARSQTHGDIDPAERPAELYAKFLSMDAWSNPGGLVMRRFRAGTPYEGEELYLSSPDERVFSARCPQSGQSTQGLEELCLWQSRIAGLDFQVRFPPSRLTEWEHLASGVRSLAIRLTGKAS